MSETNDTQRKSALVTGSSRGIGLAVASELAQAGYNVCLNCSSERGLAAQKRAFEVHIDDAVEVFLLHAHHQPVVGDAGVVHQHVKAAKRLMSR